MLSVLVATMFCTAVQAETTECTEIVNVPTVITQQGVYCLKKDLSNPISTGAMIDIQAHNVTIDLNGWKLGGGAAGPGTNARGIRAVDRRNITIRNGSIRQFRVGVSLEDGANSNSSGHILEDLKLDGNIATGAFVAGDNVIIRDNQIIDTGTIADPVGLWLTNGNRVWVTGNMISGVNGTASIRGISLSGIKGGEISNNVIMDVSGSTGAGYGIYATNTTALYKDNSIINNYTGNIGKGHTGIKASVQDSSKGICLDNTIIGYYYPAVDCRVTDRNDHYAQ